MIDEAGGPALIFLGVFFRPPVAQIAVQVELAAFVVETMCKLVPDDGSDRAVVGGLVETVVKERRLQNSRRKVDVVLLRIVVGVDGRRSHAEFGAIHRLSDFAQVAQIFMFA